MHFDYVVHLRDLKFGEVYPNFIHKQVLCKGKHTNKHGNKNDPCY